MIPIIFELTKDSRLLGQYYQLRGDCYQRELGLSEFDGSEEELDQQGHILIARQGERCIAGARISPRLDVIGPLFDLNVKTQNCCMWERLVIDPDVRSVQLARDFVVSLIEISRVLGYRHALLLSSLRNARYYRLCHSALGMDFEIHRPVPHCAQGDFSQLEHYLSVSHLQQGVAAQLSAAA